MSTLRAGLSPLSWLALLALLGRVAHADSTLVLADNHLEYKPTITAASNHQYSSRYGKNAYLTVMYGEKITLTCSSNNASNLVIQDEEHQTIRAKNLNSTSIYVSLKADVIGEYRFYCTDNNHTDCLDLSVLPAMSVTAPNLRVKLDKHDTQYFFVPRGEEFTVSCSANKVKSLIMTNVTDGSELYLQSVVVNDTTISATVTDKTRGGYFQYSCSDLNTENIVFVRVDYHPEARAFQCVLHQEQKLVCTWKSSSEVNNFKLFVLNGQETFVCLDRSGNLTGGCASALDGEWSNSVRGNFSLKLQTCNDVFCDSQTFSMNSTIITKLGPVHNLKVSKTTSHSATLEWNHEVVNFVKYKMEYRMIPGTYGSWQMDTSSVQCELLSKTCEVQVALPCPDTQYEIRVYLKYRDAPGDIYWSDPVHISFYTVKSTGEVKLVCDPLVRIMSQTLSKNGDNSLLKKLASSLEHKDNGTIYTQTVYM